MKGRCSYQQLKPKAEEEEIDWAENEGREREGA